jgi:hypothetical protein
MAVVSCRQVPEISNTSILARICLGSLELGCRRGPGEGRSVSEEVRDGVTRVRAARESHGDVGPMTDWFLATALRRAVPRRSRPWPAVEGEVRVDRGPVRLGGILSPGAWVPPPGVKPGWNWFPRDVGGAYRRFDPIPVWVRLWLHTPWIDRYAAVWMWRHGGWEIMPPEPNLGDLSGDREPRPPGPRPPVGILRLDPPADGRDRERSAHRRAG